MTVWLSSQQRPNTASHEDFPALSAVAGSSFGASSSRQQPSSGSSSGQQQQLPLQNFGLTGLLGVIKPTDQDLSSLALGFDLNSFGFNLNSPDPWFRTFASPWSDGPTRVQPEFRIPSCYYLQPPALRFEMFKQFTQNTLFYIFYTMPNDVLQLAAAQELFDRKWRYHKDMKAWITRAPGAEVAIQTATYERGSYLTFDPEKWEKVRLDDFLLEYDMIEEKTQLQESTQTQASSSSPVQSP